MNLVTIFAFTTILLSGYSGCYKISKTDSKYAILRWTRASEWDQKFKTFLEKFKGMMQVGDETLGLPVLDPFQKDLISFWVLEPEVTLNALLSQLKVSGTSEYTVNDAGFGLIGMQIMMNITWPSIYFKTQYVINGSAESYPVFGHGEVEATLSDLNFFTKLKISTKEVERKRVTYIKEMNSELHLQSLKFRVDGLYNDDALSEVISGVVSDLAPQLIEDYQKDITDMLNEIVMQAANEQLSSLSLSDIIAIISK